MKHEDVKSASWGCIRSQNVIIQKKNLRKKQTSMILLKESSFGKIEEKIPHK